MYQNKASEVSKTAPLIYYALIISQVIYGIILVQLDKFNLGAFSPEPVVIILLCLAILAPLLGNYFSRKFLGRAENEGDILIALLLGWGLAESACVFGFAAAMVSGQGMPYLATFAYSLSFMVRQRPAKELFGKVQSIKSSMTD